MPQHVHNACVNRHSHRKKAESKEANSGETRSNCQCWLIVDRRINSRQRLRAFTEKLRKMKREGKKQFLIFRALITPLRSADDLKFDSSRIETRIINAVSSRQHSITLAVSDVFVLLKRKREREREREPKLTTKLSKFVWILV